MSQSISVELLLLLLRRFREISRIIEEKMLYLLYEKGSKLADYCADGRRSAIPLLLEGVDCSGYLLHSVCYIVYYQSRTSSQKSPPRAQNRGRTER